jgi:ABC-type transport system involved in multi-copper enzyme maturation permease subunit
LDTRPATAPEPPRYAPNTVQASLRVFDLSVGEMLWSRRTIFMALVVGLPVVIAVVVRLIAVLGDPNMRVNSVAVDGPTMFGLMIWLFYMRFSIPVLGVFYGTSLIADEVEDKTITYLFTRPIPRGAVLLGKYLAYLACTILVILPSIVVVWLLILPMGGSLATSFIDMVKDLAIVAVGLAIYGAVFAFVGAAVKRPLLAGLVFIFGWEPIVMAMPGYFKHLTVAFYLQGLVPQAMPNDSALGLAQSIFREIPPLSESIVWMAAIGIGFLALAMRIVTRREYVLEQ